MRLTRILQAHPQRSVHGAYAIAAAALCAAPFAAAQYALAQPAPAPAAQSALSFAIAPLDGRLTSTFGERPDPFTGASRFHNGIDIAAPLGAPIAAPAAGRVTRLERGAAGYGDMLEIDHGQGYVTRYGQLSAFDVSLGDAVAAGQIIARVGQSGRATGPHLHLEVYKDAVVIDPASVLITPTAE